MATITVAVQAANAAEYAAIRPLVEQTEQNASSQQFTVTWYDPELRVVLTYGTLI